MQNLTDRERCVLPVAKCVNFTPGILRAAENLHGTNDNPALLIKSPWCFFPLRILLFLEHLSLVHCTLGLVQVYHLELFFKILQIDLEIRYLA